MDSESQLPSAPLPSQPLSSPGTPTPHKSRFDTFRASTRRGIRGILFACILFLVGLLCGVIGTFVLLFAISTDNSAVANSSPPATNAIVVQVGASYITHLVSNALQSSGLPGSIQNVQVTFVTGDQATITGDDQISVLGIGTSKHFTLVIQPFVNACQVKVHVLHADLGGITVTGFASAFEGQINQRIQVNTSKLPGGFTYCTSSVSTTPQGVSVTYSAKPNAATTRLRPLFAGV